ncbi:hypothetical protein TNCV_2670291 [Trichonephila clavipes]|nr:hypothetical protein TNCV_2670291 [Trichonephila clavipes]
MESISDGPRNFVLWSSDEDDTGAGMPSPSFHTTLTGRREHSQYRFKLISGPGHRISTGRYSVPRHWRIEIYNQKIGLSPAYPGPYECFRAQAPNE